MLDDDYVARLACNLLRAKVWLNGCSVYEARGDEAKIAELSLRPWIVDGVNRLEVFLAPAESASEPEEDEEPMFSLSVFATLRGVSPSAVNEIVRYVWTDNESSLEPHGMRSVFSHALALRNPWGPWSWQEAEAFRPEDRPAIEARVAELHGAIARRDLLRAIGLVERKLAELARGLGVPEEGLREELREELSAIMAAPDFQTGALRPEQLAIETAAEGRLVHVRGPGGAAPITASGGGRALSLPLSLCRLPEGWCVVR